MVTEFGGIKPWIAGENRGGREKRNKTQVKRGNTERTEFVVQDNNKGFGVMDGHGGVKVEEGRVECRGWEWQGLKNNGGGARDGCAGSSGSRVRAEVEEEKLRSGRGGKSWDESGGGKRDKEEVEEEVKAELRVAEVEADVMADEKVMVEAEVQVRWRLKKR